eukprot:gene41628-55198_t
MDWNRLVDPKAYSVDDMPPYPARVLTQHVAIKGLQIGSVAGLIIVPVLSVIRGRKLSSTWKVVMPVACTLGAAASLGILYYKAEFQKVLDVEGVDDRAYRIKHNANQSKADLYSGVGAVAGATIGILSKGYLGTAIAGSLTGVGLGVIAMGAQLYYNKHKDEVDPIVENLY